MKLLTRKNLFRIAGAGMLALSSIFGLKSLNNRHPQDNGTDRMESDWGQVLTENPSGLSAIEAGIPTPETEIQRDGGYKTNSVSSYKIVEDPFGAERECLIVRPHTSEDPQTAFGVVRAIDDPEIFDAKVDLLFEDGRGGYVRVKTFEKGEVPGDEWRIIQPGTIACERK